MCFPFKRELSFLMIRNINVYGGMNRDEGYVSCGFNWIIFHALRPGSG